MKNKIIWIVIVVLLVLLGAFYFTTNKEIESDVIKIGFIGALSGDVASVGIEDKNAVELAVREINDNGGIDGKLVEVIYEDGKCEGPTAVNAINKLINIDKVKIILGGTCSSETLAIAPVAQENKVVLFTSFALSPLIRNSGDYVFRNVPADDVAAKSLADLAFKNGVRRVGILTANEDYANAFRDSFVNEFNKRGGLIVFDEKHTTSHKDFRTMITKLNQSNPDALLINSQAGSTGLIAKQLNELGEGLPLYGNVYFAAADVINDFGTYLNYGYFSQPADLDINSEKVKEFFANYKKNFGQEPSVAPFWAAARYDSVYIIAKAISASKSGETESIQEQLSNLENYQGLIGTYGMDYEGEPVGINFINKQIVDGQFIDIK